MHQFHKIILSWNSTCFGQFVCPSSGVYWLCTQEWYMSYRFVDSFRGGSGWNSWSCSKAAYKPVWHIPFLSTQWINFWWWAEELSETCRVSWKNNLWNWCIYFVLLQRSFTDSFLVFPSAKRNHLRPLTILNQFLLLRDRERPSVHFGS
jgi:hypothetical protein